MHFRLYDTLAQCQTIGTSMILPVVVMPWHWQSAGKDGGKMQYLLP